MILQYRLHFYWKSGTNNRLFCECDFERFGFYAHVLYGFVFDGCNGTYFTKLYTLHFLPLVSCIYVCMCMCICIPMREEAIAEVQNWRQNPVKRGLNLPECSIHIRPKIFLFMVLCLQSEGYVDL